MDAEARTVWRCVVKITAQVQNGGQTGPNSFESYTRVMDVDEETMVGEILEWARRGMYGCVIKIVLKEKHDE